MVALPAAGQAGWTWRNRMPQGNPLNAVFFVDAQRGVAVGDQGVIIRTSDGGVTWNVEDGRSYVDLVDVWFTDADNGVAVGDVGTVLRTSDGGVSWTPVDSGIATGLLALHFVDGNTGSALSGTIYRTTDGGTTWSAQTSAHPTEAPRGIFFTDALHGTVVGDRGTIQTTDDGGQTWTAREAGTTLRLWSVAYTDVDTGVAVGDFGTILRTTDGGETWTDVDSPLNRDIRDVWFSDAQNGYAVGENGVYRTTDGGLTWDAETVVGLSGLTGVSGFGADVSVVGNSTVIARSADAGTTWTLQHSGSSGHLRDVRYADATTAVAVGSPSWRTTDGGGTWAEIEVGGSAISFGTAEKGIIAGSGGAVSRTTDAGATWEAVLPRPQPERILNGVHFVDGDHAWAVGNVGTVHHSADGGLTWSQQDPGVTVTLEDVHFVSATTGTIVGFAVILRTTDGGATWTPQTHPAAGNLRAVSFSDENNGTVVGDGGTILRTTDGGDTWTPQSYEPPPFVTPNLNLHDVVQFDAQSAAVVGVDGLLLRTIDGGSTWGVERRVAAHTLVGVAGPDIDHLTVAGFSGALLSFDGDGEVATEEPAMQRESAPTVGNYPNPLAERTTIRFTLPRASRVTLSVYDVLGRRVARLASGLLPAGEHERVWEPGAAAAGMYFHVLEADGRMAVGRMTVVR